MIRKAVGMGNDVVNKKYCLSALFQDGGYFDADRILITVSH